ncbi:MAG TPA: phosphatidylinositol mannoside acyltransferase [Actinomycetota bacterium]|nr:phosphatidylinositol mannoside acyltransferase [Actinomycetota bacterium]
MSERETLSERLAFRAYATIERVARALPERSGRWIFALCARLAHKVMPRVRQTVVANQARVLGLPEDDALVRASTREAFGLYARFWFDSFRLRDLEPGEAVDRFGGEGMENLDRALAAGKGAIAVTLHMGNWDAAGHWFAELGYPIVAVAEALRPKRLQELFLEQRRALGMRIVPLSGDNVGRRLAAELKAGAVVALVADRDLAGRGIEVEMFGKPRRLPAGPAMLALSTGAPILLCPSFTTERGSMCRIQPPIEFEPSGKTKDDVRALTRLLAREFERLISERPADWHMFQPAWT